MYGVPPLTPTRRVRPAVKDQVDQKNTNRGYRPSRRWGCTRTPRYPPQAVGSRRDGAYRKSRLMKTNKKPHASNIGTVSATDADGNPPASATSETGVVGQLDGVGAKAVESAAVRKYERDPQGARCSARSRRTGDPCNNPPMHGTTVCRMHGGSAPQVKAAARVRIERAADRMAEKLLNIALDDGTPAPVALAAVKDALDRAGVSAKTAVEVTVGPAAPWESVLENLVGGSRSESRAARGVEDPDAGEIIDADWLPEDDGYNPVRAAYANNRHAPAHGAGPQPPLDGAEPRQGGPAGPDGAPGGGADVKPRRAKAKGSPIISLDEAHPDPEAKPKKRNAAITPKMRDPYNGRRSAF